MSRFADIRVEWRVETIERDLYRKAEQHEVSTLRSDVDRLECSNRELSSKIDGLCSELQGCKDQINILIQHYEQFVSTI